MKYKTKKLKRSWGHGLYINLFEKYWQQWMYTFVFLLFQVLLGIAASWNECVDHYIGLLYWQLLIGLFGIWFVGAKKGNLKLVLYTVMLLSIGQLVQAIIQKEEVYSAYMSEYNKFMAIAVVGAVGLYFAYRKWFVYLYTWQMQFLVGAVLIGCFVLLKSPLGKAAEDGALLWIQIGSVRLQITEFFKPLTVMLLAGLLCRKKKLVWWQLLLSLGCIGVVSGLCVVWLNEFGTGIVVALTGVLMYFVFQNTRMSKVVAGLTVIGVGVLVGIYIWGSNLYSSIPMKVSAEIYAEEFTACCNKGELANKLENLVADLSKEEIQAKEVKMTDEYNALVEEANAQGLDDVKVKSVTYSDICYFLRNEIAQDLVNKSYPSTEGLGRAQRKLVRYIQVLASDDEDDSFRRMYRDTFIEKKIYANRMLSAYRKYQETQSDGGIGQAIKQKFLEEYLPIAEKVQRKFSGLLNPEGESKDNAYQVNNAMAAMSTAGLFGNGADITKNDKSRIYSYQSDMVFTMIVSELGYLMGVVVIILNLLIFQEMLFVGLDVSELYQKGICAGMGFGWIVQALFIIGGNCRIFPLAGVTLPLIAQGGTSLIVSLWIVVLVLLISMYPISAKRVYSYKKKLKVKKYASSSKSEEKKKRTEKIKATARKSLEMLDIDDDDDETDMENDSDVPVKDTETDKDLNIELLQTHHFEGKNEEKTKIKAPKDDWENPFRDM